MIMPTIVKKIDFSADNKPKKSEVPITVLWNNSRMIRIHSIRATIREILNLSESLDVVKINIIGPPGTGKTTLGEVIQHLSHKMSKIPYTARTFTREDLLNFEETLKTLTPTNHVLLFDDVSFLSATAGKRQIDKIQKAFTEIRHLPGGQDVKIIAIFNFHYNMAVSKYMRQSDFFYYTSVGSSELENTQNIVGKKYTKKIMDFRRVYQQALTKKEYTFNIGKKGQKFTYKFREPFAPLLFWNNDSLRVVVSPKRKWIDPICSACSGSKSESVKASADMEKFDDERKKFGISIFKQAMRIKLFNMGVTTYSKRVKQCMQWIDQQMEESLFNIEELADHYDLREKDTKLKI